MRRILGAALACSLAVPSLAFAADLATPTAVKTAATPIATPIRQEPHARVVASGACVFNAISIAAMSTATMIPQVRKFDCGVPGAETSDVVFAVLENYDSTGAGLAYDALSLDRCTVNATNTISCYLRHTGATALDPAPLTVRYVVYR